MEDPNQEKSDVTPIAAKFGQKQQTQVFYPQPEPSSVITIKDEGTTTLLIVN